MIFQQAGFGFFGWLIIVIVVTTLWSLITKKNDDKNI
jgi:hypothetical protein